MESIQNIPTRIGVEATEELPRKNPREIDESQNLEKETYAQVKTPRERFEAGVTSIIEFMELNNFAAEQVASVVVDLAVLFVTDRMTHGSIVAALQRFKLDRRAIVNAVLDTSVPYRSNGEPLPSQRAHEVIFERTEMLDTQPFDSEAHREQAARLMRSYQRYDVLRALGSLNEDQALIWSLERTDMLNEVVAFSNYLLERQYDPLDVARILRIITANPRIKLEDNVAH